MARETDGTGFSWETNGQDFQAIYHENVTLIYRFVLSHVGNREEAEKVLREMFQIRNTRGMPASHIAMAYRSLTPKVLARLEKTPESATAPL